MVHLTLTGYGSITQRTLCQHDESLLASNNTYYHAMYCTDAVLAQDDICQACKAIWLDDTNTDVDAIGSYPLTPE